MATPSLSDADKKLLRALTEDGRASRSALGQAVGLTRQAVADRMDRLQSEGVISGFTVAVDPAALGASLRAFIAISLMPACTDAEESRVISLLEADPCVRECYRVTGDDYFQIRVVAPDITAIRRLVTQLRATGIVQSTRTMLSLEVMFEKSAIGYVEFNGPVHYAPAERQPDSSVNGCHDIG